LNRADEQIIATLIEAMASLVQRVGTVESVARVPGQPGERGEDGKDGQDGRDGQDAPPVTDEQIKSAATEWLTANITQPADGKDGQDGRDADPITAEQIQLAVDLWFEINRDSIRGERGPQGERGASGEQGPQGERGERGRDGDSIVGPAGREGTGIALIEQRDEASFHITLTDGREFEIELPRGKSGTTLIGGGGGGIREIVGGVNIIVDNSDPQRPVVSSIGGSGGDSYIQLPAGEPINAYKVVTTGADGRVIYGDAGTVEHQGRIIGVAINSASIGGNVAIADSGIVTNPSWTWTPGAVLYVGLSGNITTQQVGVFSQNLGYARTATEIFIRLGRSVVRG